MLNHNNPITFICNDSECFENYYIRNREESDDGIYEHEKQKCLIIEILDEKISIYGSNSCCNERINNIMLIIEGTHCNFWEITDPHNDENILDDKIVDRIEFINYYNKYISTLLTNLSDPQKLLTDLNNITKKIEESDYIFGLIYL